MRWRRCDGTRFRPGTRSLSAANLRTYSEKVVGRRIVALALLTVTALVSGSCGYFWRGPPPVRLVAQVVEEANCAIPSSLIGHSALPIARAYEPSPLPGAIPDGFEPVAAITCDPWHSSTVGPDLTVTFYEHRWTGDFTEVVKNLKRPSEGQRLDQDTCPVASLAALPDLWLINSDGLAMRPSYPVDECNFAWIRGLRDVERLDEVATIEHRVQLTLGGLVDVLGR